MKIYILILILSVILAGVVLAQPASSNSPITPDESSIPTTIFPKRINSIRTILHDGVPYVLATTQEGVCLIPHPAVASSSEVLNFKVNAGGAAMQAIGQLIGQIPPSDPGDGHLDQSEDTNPEPDPSE